MNHYGLLARDHWKKYAPARYATLASPEEHFEELGETIATQIATIADSLERDLPPNLGYLERVGQLKAIQKQAEEIVLTDLVWSVPTETSSLAEELEEMLGGLPSPSMIETALDRIEQAAEDEAEEQGWEQPILSEQEEAEKRQLTDLLPMVTLETDPQEMSEPELRDRILALRPFWDPHNHRLIDLP